MAYHGIDSFLTMGSETDWGVTPGTPVFYHVPVTSYGVKMNRDRRNSATFVGIQQRKHGRSYRGMPAGSMQTFLYGWKPGGAPQSIMQFLIDWACSQPETINKLSKFADWAEGPDIANVRHNGLRVNGCTIEGSADSGTVTISLDLMGKTEEALVTAQALPDDREKCVEADWVDCSFELGGSAIELRSFRWQIQNNLAATYLGSRSPSYLAAGQLVETLNFVHMKESDAYAAYNRAFDEQELTGQLVLKAPHNGTGTAMTDFTVLTVDFARLAFVNPDSTPSLASLVEEGLNFEVLKPDTNSAAKTLTYTEE